MTACAVWLARDFLRRHARPIDIPPCTCPATECPPIEETAMTKPALGEADAALAAGYTPDPDCACDGNCRWCALWTCEHCCNSYAADHGVREPAEVTTA